MRNGVFWAALVTVTIFCACGVPNRKYYTQVARANKLEIHLRMKLDRIDFLEAKEKLARKKVREGRKADLERLTRLTTGLALVRAALLEKKRALSQCRATRAKVRRPPPVSLTIRASKCDKHGVTVALGEGMILRSVGPATRRSRARSRVRAALRQVLPPIARCYLKATTQKPQAIPGNLVVTLRIDKRGRARRVRAVHRGLPARRVVRCVLKALRRLKVADLDGPFFAALPLRFGRSKTLAETLAKACAKRDRSGVDRATIDRIINSHRGAIQYCFIGSGLPAKKLRKARVKVAFTILATGRVGPVTVVSSVLAHAGCNACILRTVKRWRFPRPDSTTPMVTPEFRWRKKRRRRRRRRRWRRRRRR